MQCLHHRSVRDGEQAPTRFRRFRVREGEQVFVFFSAFRDAASYEHYVAQLGRSRRWTDGTLKAFLTRIKRPPEILRLSPTAALWWDVDNAVPILSLVDHDLTLPHSLGNYVRLNGSTFEIPTYDNADAFVNKLAREGLLVSDRIVSAVLRGRETDLSQRSVERRVRRATGLTLGAIRQIERAKKAAELLDQGATILDVVLRAGYADQAHLTRSLKRFMGQTPAQIAKEAV